MDHQNVKIADFTIKAHFWATHISTYPHTLTYPQPGGPLHQMAKKFRLKIDKWGHFGPLWFLECFKSSRGKKFLLLVKMVIWAILAHFGSRYLLNKRTHSQKFFFGEQAPQGVLTMSRIQRYQFWVLHIIVPFSIHSMLSHKSMITIENWQF